MRSICTIGVYGTDRAAFFDALANAGVDALLDLRRRRAVRGARYAFANARRLTHELGLRNIRYLHLLDLAPDPALLALQHAADARNGRKKSQRETLDPEYVARYAQILDRFDFDALAAALVTVTTPALLCIEREPAACHRSLVAPRLAAALGGRDVIDLMPERV